MKVLGLAGLFLALLTPVWAEGELAGTYALKAAFTDAQGAVSARGDVYLTVTGATELVFTRSFTSGDQAQALRSKAARVLARYTSNGRAYHQVEVTYPVASGRGASGALAGDPIGAAGDLRVYYYWPVDDPATIIEWTRNQDRLPFPPVAADRWVSVEAHGKRRVVVDLPLGDPEDLEPPPPALALFVYGTLMRGERNHRFMKGATFLRAVQTTAAYQLWHLGSYPGLTRGTARVRGELYEMTPSLLERVDALEATAPEGYERLRVTLEGGGTAWGYVLDRAPRGARRIASGSWN